MRRLVDRNTIRCDVVERDRYDRAVATCFAAGRDVQRELVRQGLALAWRRYSMRYVPDEDTARAERLGMWAGAFVEPWRWRKRNRAGGTPGRRQSPGDAAPQSSGSCLIKGNISRSGRIYHVPGADHYDGTRIDEARGERWFCSEAEARTAGWRRARR